MTSPFTLEYQFLKPRASISMDPELSRHCGHILLRLCSDQWTLQHKAIEHQHNVVGSHSSMLSSLFERQARRLSLDLEQTCRELRNLGFRVPDMVEMLQLGKVLVAARWKWPDESGMVKLQLDDVETVCCWLMKEMKELLEEKRKTMEETEQDEVGELVAVMDFLEETMRSLKEMAMELRNHLDKRKASVGHSVFTF